MKPVRADASASQTEHPWRATARTLIQSILGALVTVGGILLLTPGAMDEVAAALEEVGVIVPAVLIALPPVIARIMAIPGVEAALRKIGLGAAPRGGDIPAAEESPIDDPDDGDEEIDPDELADLAAAEVDQTPPPSGYEPRH